MNQIEKIQFDVDAAIKECEQASTLVATDTESAEQVNLSIKQLSSLKRKLEKTKLELTKPMRDEVAEINAKFKSATDRIGEATKTLKGTAGKYLAEIRRKEQEAIAAQVEADRKKREAEEEKERARKEAEEEATQSGDQFDGELFDMLSADDNPEAIEAPAVIEKPESHGVQTRTHYEVEITDPLALCKAIAAGQIPVEAINGWSLTVLKKYAKENPDTEIPGVSVDVQERIAA